MNKDPTQSALMKLTADTEQLLLVASLVRQLGGSATVSGRELVASGAKGSKMAIKVQPDGSLKFTLYNTGAH